MKSSFDEGLLTSGELMKRGYSLLAENVGKTVAIITGIVAVLVTFTEVGFLDVNTESFTSTLILMLIASYLMYFSLEDAGEKLGRESVEYTEAEKRYDAIRRSISGEMLPSLREFCTEYSKEELSYRRSSLLLSSGYTEEEFEAYLKGKSFPKEAERIFKRVEKMKSIELSPSLLLEKNGKARRSELTDPERHKLPTLLLKLIPSTLCMIFTVSIMITTKEGLTIEGVIEGILKLSTLPVIGLKGYSGGYSYAKYSLTEWLNTKHSLLEAFLKRESK